MDSPRSICLNAGVLVAEQIQMLRALLLLPLLLSLGSAHAAVTTVASYRLGEADPGAVAGGAGADPTRASIGSVDLVRSGAPVYSSQTPPTVASSLSMRFAGGADRYTGALISSATDNFGIEAWVRSDGNTALNSTLAYNGNTGSSGWGLFRLGNQYGFLYGGVVAQPVVTLGTGWTHLALVRDNGTSRFFVNGFQRFNSGSGPNPPAGSFLLGGNPLVASEGFDGLIDEVRVFTFAPGQFSPADLNLGTPPMPTQIPLDSTGSRIALAMLLLLIGALALRRPW